MTKLCIKTLYQVSLDQNSFLISGESRGRPIPPSPTGPSSFILTYIFAEKRQRQGWRPFPPPPPSQRGQRRHQREIMDPGLVTYLTPLCDVDACALL